MVHLGIIPDGNRRWCKNNNITYDFLIEHWLNNMIIKNIKLLIKYNEKYKQLTEIRNLSLYVSSIDNIYREDKTHELGFMLIRKLYKLFTCIELYLEEFEEYEREKIDKIFKEFSLNIIGDIELLPEDIQNILNKAKSLLSGSKYSINIAIGYDYNKESFTQENNNKNYIREQSNIDLVFRSGGEKRLSGFFPTKTIYSELYFIDKFFPDINLDDINDAITEYKKRNRRYGK